MDDDPDDLAAAFFAQQAAKEKAKATLPTDDWIRVVEAAKKKLAISSSAAAVDDKDTDGQSRTRTGKGGEDNLDPSSWLVTAMPPAPNHAAERNEGGVVGIVVDSSDARRCSLEGRRASDDEDNEIELTAEEEETRRRIVEYLVRKLEEEYVRCCAGVHERQQTANGG
mmetsp:Transcript_20424/g.43802  ORF Transcript_20424/g.43802 Transcript_20424/m.43802 type:complete len:168 (-) Transcript_20424:286-789(-)